MGPASALQGRISLVNGRDRCVITGDGALQCPAVYGDWLACRTGHYSPWCRPCECGGRWRATRKGARGPGSCRVRFALANGYRIPGTR